ncbi:asparagine synthase-related protein [uncultured Winogradskyella sp.]|uniref:asparagine synthase-related protein n=1 Tax=uncultured Winogradskyella sp. TaxID=395353 RepID=UPI00261C0579|nr:asparagine synthase-related protein [uncultured Winogradskyella sp.]
MSRSVKTPILPYKQEFAKKKGVHEVNYKAICIFAATGFFLDDDTYFKDEVCLRPSHNHFFDKNDFLVKSEPWFHWHYSPRDISFDQALKEYIQLLTTITKEQVGDEPVILPLSGGLDSRSQALIFKDLGNPVNAYSYSFPGGYPEHKISKRIAKVCNFSFNSYKIPQSYLWNCIDDLALLNGCYSEFTHPRQMAVLEELKQMKGVFSLGHWGDVLFDKGAPDTIEEKDIVPLLKKKMLKPGGLEFAQSLWNAWHLDGEFDTYFTSRIESSLSEIKIDNISAKVRAFKTSQWAHRWTTTNLCVFEAARPINLPYYDDRMLEFICTIPEEYLTDRRLQIAHLKQNKALSKITWHEHKPFNLNNYHYNKSPFNLPYRIIHKLKREFNAMVGNPYIQRNFELQLLGTENDEQFQKYIFDSSFLEFVPKEVVNKFYHKFKEVDTVYYSPPVSMLLTLSLWNKHFRNN